MVLLHVPAHVRPVLSREENKPDLDSIRALSDHERRAHPPADALLQADVREDTRDALDVSVLLPFSSFVRHEDLGCVTTCLDGRLPRVREEDEPTTRRMSTDRYHVPRNLKERCIRYICTEYGGSSSSSGSAVPMLFCNALLVE